MGDSRYYFDCAPMQPSGGTGPLPFQGTGQGAGSLLQVAQPRSCRGSVCLSDSRRVF